MKQTMFFVFATSFILCNFASATPWISTLQKQAARRAMGPTRLLPVSPAACTNFSGTWKGTCESGGQKTDDTQVIYQDGCTTLISNSDWLNVGGMRNEVDSLATESGFALGTASATTYDWSQDRSTLIVRSYGLVKQIGADSHAEFNGNGSMRIENGRLLFAFEIVGIKVACVYDKQ